MSIQTTVQVGLNALPCYVSITATTNYTPSSYARAILRQDNTDNFKRYDNYKPILEPNFIETFTPCSNGLNFVNAEQALSQLPVNEASLKLKSQHDELIQRYLSELPLLENENVKSLSLGILKKPCELPSGLILKVGTLLALRSSNLAETQFLIPSIRVDTKNGIPVFTDPLQASITSENTPKKPHAIQLMSSQLNLFAMPTGTSIADDSGTLLTETQFLPSFAASLQPSMTSDIQPMSFQSSDVSGTLNTMWDLATSVGGCVIWVAPMPWNAIGAGIITAVKLLFGGNQDTSQNTLKMVNLLTEKIQLLITEVELQRAKSAFDVYAHKMTEIDGLISNRYKNKPLDNGLITREEWLGGNEKGLNHYFNDMDTATTIIKNLIPKLDPDATLGYHQCYVAGVLCMVQLRGTVAKMQAQFAANIGQCSPPDLNTDKLAADQVITINETTKFLDETAKFYEEYTKFRNLCVGYIKTNPAAEDELIPGYYQEISKMAHDLWYEKIRSITAVFFFEAEKNFIAYETNGTAVEGYTWVDVNEKVAEYDNKAFNEYLDKDLKILDTEKTRAEELYKTLHDKKDSEFWNGLIEHQKGSEKLDWKPLVYFCQYVKTQKPYLPELWPTFTELTEILKNIDWENSDNYNKAGGNPISQAEKWLTQVTNPGFDNHIWWMGPGNVDDDKKTPLPLCREAAAEILELFLTKQIRTHINSYVVNTKNSDKTTHYVLLDKHQKKSTSESHNICCTGRYTYTYTHYPDEPLKDRDDQLVKYLETIQLKKMAAVALQIHDSIYSASSLMCPCPPDTAPTITKQGTPPKSDFWQTGNTVEYRYSFMNQAGPSPASPPTEKFLIPSEATGVKLWLDNDLLDQATQFMVYRKISRPNGEVLEDRPIGGHSIKPKQTEKLSYNDYR